ncbi:MAG TPA: alpha/beta fold hydrolase [Chitinophagaceae bacterium]|nr:alpha/beta fold hydrolase [Chitinophagaceae bacterium]
MQKKRNWFRWVKLALLLYGSIGIAIFYLQDKILYHPVSLPRDYTYDFKEPFKEVNIPYDSGASINIIQFKVPARSGDTPAAPKGVVLYLHGNRNNIAWYEPYVANFTKNGYEVWMMDYAGYGKSTGPVSEQRLYDYATQLYKLAHVHFAADSIIIYGKSLGTGIATWLASHNACKQLILETPYYSMTSLARYYFPIYPVGRMIHCKIPSYEYLQKVRAHVTILHGSADWIIPHRNARRLTPFLKPTDEFITIPGGSHNDLNDFPLFHRKLDSLLR